MDELVVATSAAVGQVVGTFVTFPLDVVKTRQQAEQPIEWRQLQINRDGSSSVLDSDGRLEQLDPPGTHKRTSQDPAAEIVRRWNPKPSGAKPLLHTNCTHIRRHTTHWLHSYSTRRWPGGKTSDTGRGVGGAPSEGGAVRESREADHGGRAWWHAGAVPF